jgi:5'-nucleotidase
VTSPTVLITNDDGIGAKGLEALHEALARRGVAEIWVCAPDAHRSACGHGMTLERPVAAAQLGERRFAIGGLPADCVYAALFGIMPRRPDVVISGVNRGPNLGTDVVYSGTVAGAREAVIRGVHGVSASLVSGDDFARAAEATVELAFALARLPGPARLLNLNFPGGAFDGPALAPLGERDYPEEAHRRVAPETGAVSFLLGGPPVVDRCAPGTDGWLIARGVASATFLAIDQTDRAAHSACPLEGLLPADFFSTRVPC